MNTSKTISKLGFFSALVITCATILVACGGDTVAISNLFTSNDASVPVDATSPVVDGGKQDAGTMDAATCTDGKSACNDACVDMQTDSANCGSCGNGCEGGTICAMGTCALACNGGSLACGDACVDQTADPGNCGACGNTCATGQVCSLSKCATTCAAGLTRCTAGVSGSDAGSTDGGVSGTAASCVDDSSDPNNCGGCGIKCGAGQLCSNGTCGTSCLTGLIQCGTKCIDPTSNDNFCGATAGCGVSGAGSAGATCTNGTVCTTGTTGSGTCAATCAANEILCGGVCIDPTSDRNNCGAKGLCTGTLQSATDYQGASCATGFACVAASGANAPAMCAPTCLQGEVLCNGTCIDPLTNNAACGAKGSCTTTAGDTADSAGANCITQTVGGVTTSLGETCTGGTCQLNCAQGQVQCNGACIDPGTNGNHCGATPGCGAMGGITGKVCDPGEVCTGGNCTVTCQGSQILCADTCVDPLTDSNACGAKGNCSNINKTGSTANSSGMVCTGGTFCSAGNCAAACSAGYVLCNGVCVNPTDDNGHCGATAGCGVVTGGVPAGASGSVCGVGTVCEPNMQGVGACSSNCSAGLAVCTNACVDQQHDPNNCGTGCVDCSGTTNGGTGGAANHVASPVCRAGTCAVAVCAPGFADCNGVVTDGCEVNLASDASHCGTCTASCSQAGGTETCNGGVCSSATCATGFADCDKNAANGCEVNTTTDVSNCSSCNAKCTGANGSADTCTASTCGYGMCNTGFGDCDNNPNNGCEDNTNVDAANCGGCGMACAQVHGTETCVGGSCTSPVCAPGYADCNGSPADGCETDLTLPATCGSCRNACSQTNGAEACVAGGCAAPTCSAGFADCDGDKTNGCETNLETTTNHCGSCANACSQANGVQTCSNGSCSSAMCGAGFGDCNNNNVDGCETNIETSAANCGGCGSACSQAHGTETCTNGMCNAPTCATGYADCDGNAANGCEVNLLTTPADCGACGTACSETNGTELCTNGTCTAPNCATGYGNCDGNKTNGCEDNLNTDTAHCGTCAISCSQNDGTEACVEGICGGPVCAMGFGNCDGNGANGCETNLTNSTANCGMCGAACSTNHATETCTASSCTVASCAAGYTDCNANASDGCEANLATDSTNCGACGNSCAAGSICASGTCVDVCTKVVTSTLTETSPFGVSVSIMYSMIGGGGGTGGGPGEWGGAGGGGSSVIENSGALVSYASGGAGGAGNQSDANIHAGTAGKTSGGSFLLAAATGNIMVLVGGGGGGAGYNGGGGGASGYFGGGGGQPAVTGVAASAGGGSGVGGAGAGDGVNGGSMFGGMGGLYVNSGNQVGGGGGGQAGTGGAGGSNGGNIGPGAGGGGYGAGGGGGAASTSGTAGSGGSSGADGVSSSGPAGLGAATWSSSMSLPAAAGAGGGGTAGTGGNAGLVILTYVSPTGVCSL